MSHRDPRRPEVPADPSGIAEPHDVLAADEFGIGTRDERLPPYAHGFEPPHDILAAEEFAMPAGIEPHEGGGGPDPRTLVPLVLIGLLLAYLFVRRRN